MVTSPNEQGVILIGCDEQNKSIYELINNDGILSWKKMSQKLKYPNKSRPTVFFIPDDLVTCH